MNKRLGLIVGIGVLVGMLAVIALGTVAFAQGPAARGQRGWGSGGMMGGHGGFATGPGQGMMGNWGRGWAGNQNQDWGGPAVRPRRGMLRGFGGVNPNCPGGGGGWPGTGTPISMNEAVDQVEEYLATWNNLDLALAEVMEFEENFYAEVMEESTGIHAFELLVNRYTGAVQPEPGPNMMWNTKYGHMAGWGGGGMGGRWGTPPSGEMTVTAGEAVEFAQDWLDANMPGVSAGEPETFYGYHTLHTLRDGEIEGMLSVNGYTGQVWYHTWHGDFIDMQEFHHDTHD